ncbi:MAG: AgmX/PglI C-terminal domain-containing protein [Gammaproteobacteria bacterium]
MYYYRTFDLPWTLSIEDEQRFRKILLNVLGIILLLSLIMPWLPTPERDFDQLDEVPPRFAKLILERQAPPPPPPPPKEIEQELEPEPEPVVEKQPEPEPIVEPEPEPEPIDRTKQARENAAMAGLLPFVEELADLRDNDALDNIMGNDDLSASVGESVRSERSLITSKAGRASGGINTASLSRGTGGGALTGRSTTRVSGPADTNDQGAAARRKGQSKKAARSREEIELVFDKNKGAIYALYNRALRRNPLLQGKVVLKLTIAPSGQVTECEIITSDLEDAELERKLVQRVKLFRFNDKDVEAVTTTKPIDFFPA